MAVATETPPKQCFLLDDDGEFPPMQGSSPTTNATSPRTRNKFSANNPSDNNDDD